MKRTKKNAPVRQQVNRVRRSDNRRALKREHGWRHFCARHLPHMLAGCICIGVLLVTLTWSRLAASANALSAAPRSTTSYAVPTASGSLLRFFDPNEGTTLIIQTNLDDPNAGVFSFIISPGGKQYHGGNAKDLLLGGNGVIEVQFPGGTVQTILPLKDGSVQIGTASVSLRGLIDTVRGRAEQFVLTDFSSKQQFFLNISEQGPADEVGAVNTYDTAATGPAPQLFNLTSRLVTAGYSESEFNKIVQEQVKSVGMITAIMPDTPSPQATDPAGITYFTVKEQVTHVKGNGPPRIQTVLAVFILEDRQWKFWFSHPV